MTKVLVRTTAAAGLFFAFASGALAAEVSKDVEVKGTPAQVWEKIGGWCSISNWHPAVATCETSKEGDAAVRHLTTKDGAKITEKQTAADATSYGYTMTDTPLPVSNYNATMGVAPSDDGKNTKITWTATFDPKGVSEDDAKKPVEGIFESGLQAIKLAMEAGP